MAQCIVITPLCLLYTWISLSEQQYSSVTLQSITDVVYIKYTTIVTITQVPSTNNETNNDKLQKGYIKSEIEMDC